MSAFKKLIGQTAIYGSSSIIGRFLNYLLTPFYVHIYSNEQYGIITEMYAYVAFLVVFLTYGMETALFRFSTNKPNERKSIYSNTLFSINNSNSFATEVNDKLLSQLPCGLPKWDKRIILAF